MSNEIYVIGFPKSGNTWLTRLLGDALKASVEAGGGHKSLSDWTYGSSEYIIRQRHTIERPETGKFVIIVRDPRDVIVSAAFYWQMGIEKYFEHMQKRENTRPPNVLHGYPDFYRAWLLGYLGTQLNQYDYLIKYEDLLNDTEGELAKLISGLGIDIPDGGRLCRVVRRNSFNRIRKTIAGAPDDRYPYGKEIQLRNLRRGISGDWVNHLKRRHGKMVHENMWYWVKRFGYETNPNWWKYLEEQ